MSMPMTSIGGVEVSRVICGSNTFFGYSHFSAARDAWLKRDFDIPKIVEVMAKCAEFGVNCVLSGPDPRMYRAIQELERCSPLLVLVVRIRALLQYELHHLEVSLN